MRLGERVHEIRQGGNLTQRQIATHLDLTFACISKVEIEKLRNGDTPLVLLCPAWKKWGTATTIKPNSTILHSRADDVVTFANSEELIRNSGLPAAALIETGTDHRLADP